MTIVLSGAGSGGHITPILAVAAELKRLRPSVRLVYIGQKGDALGDIPREDPNIDVVFTVRAGKFRRYHGEGLKQLFDVPTTLKNLRDAVYVLVGLWQSRRLLLKLRPDAVFIKGGFVGVPVGLAAASLHLPYVTHDSDAIPGLANRIIARWATRHAVALPKDIYAYSPDKTVTTGIPLQAEFSPVTAAEQKKYRSEINIPDSAKLLFVIGGGLGAQRINSAVAEIMPHLLNEHKDLYVVHGVGRANEQAMEEFYKTRLRMPELARLRTFGYVSDVYRYSGAADIIITRAGATNLAEFALQGKACIIIPSPFLTGGHQLKNARYLQDQQAAIVIDERDIQADPNRLARQVSDLLKNADLRQQLGHRLADFSKPDATNALALLLLEVAQTASPDTTA